MFPAPRKTLEHLTASRALKFCLVLKTALLCSKTVLSTLKHCLLPYLTNDRKVKLQQVLEPFFRNTSNINEMMLKAVATKQEINRHLFNVST